jgi:hypothetical protein
MTTLSKEDKISIINQHKRSVEYSKYNLSVSLIEENSVLSPDDDVIADLTAKIADHNSKLSALDAEADSL